MKALLKVTTIILLTMSSAAYATSQPQEDPREMLDATVKTKNVKYTCQSGKKLTVKYGFNKQNLPTYAEATLNGKKRFMPVNLYRSDNVSTIFGDENNFSVLGGVITYKNVGSSSVNVQSPASEILFKSCQAIKR
ncbi:MAG: adhesin [Moraxella sp.]|nr:adhesin [Moraxella sp.]